MRLHMLMLTVGITLFGSTITRLQAPAAAGKTGSAATGEAASDPEATVPLLALAEPPASDSRLAAVASGPDAPAASDSPVTAALAALSKHVRKQSHPDALRLALQAYYNYKAAHPAQLRNPYYYYVDYGLDNRTPRGYVFDMKALELVEGPFTVAHGRGSSKSRNGAPTSFSNVPGSAATSLGLYLTQETYGFSGTAAGGRYSSIGLRLRGLSGGFNSAARRRGVVAHGAPYVTAGDAGRSEGCPAMEQGRARRLIPQIANGGLVFLFSPRDQNWLKTDPWINGGAAKAAK
jgi:hypothetical protein